MAVERVAGPAPWLYYVRIAVTVLLLAVLSRRAIPLRPSQPVLSAILGAFIFALWIAPDALFGYRHHWLFENGLTGHAVSSLPEAARHSVAFLAVRTFGCALVVPIIEELFWRGWLMRWLINRAFLKVPVGAYAPSAFWIVAVLFASEHGPYWEVGLATGVILNWWVIRTKNLADCVFAHIVANSALSFFVLRSGEWQYWL